ncbi:NAD-dependent succinate-semialdehyde dehydrogenase [Castellaniella sp.]|uniref:NAD-dependent succinate-semialdehyde dehydrogenase n=1 Tax=Castellaniella sp. TaxID=1955812 RepID=UPI00355EDF1C
MIQSPLLDPIAGYIAGQWVDADSAARVDVTNPATGEVLASVPAMGAEETGRAIAAAQAALATIPDIETRRQWLQQANDALLANKKEIGRILCMEHGKPWPEAQGEVEYAASFFDYYARTMVDILAPEHLPGEFKGCTWSVHKRPIGVVGLITPWNFPIAMIAKKLAPALAAGCPSVIKPAKDTPLTMVALFRILHDHLQLPAGMVNLVMGNAGKIGGALMGSPTVRMVSFTGSTEVGQLLLEQSRADVKKLGLELGGNAPFIVCDDADIDGAIDGLMANKFRGAGQTCVCANRVYVHTAVYDEFAQKLFERVNALKVGNGMDEGVDIGPLINAAGFEKVREHVADALARGAHLKAGPRPDELDAARSLLYPPSVLTEVTHDMRCCQEETFGPLVPLIRFDDDAKVIEQANDTSFGLAAYLYTQDEQRAAWFMERLHFGHCGYNTGMGPAAHTPFGGMLTSGLGREGGHEGLLEYVELQTIPQGISRAS